MYIFFSCAMCQRYRWSERRKRAQASGNLYRCRPIFFRICSLLAQFNGAVVFTTWLRFHFDIIYKIFGILRPQSCRSYSFAEKTNALRVNARYCVWHHRTIIVNTRKWHRQNTEANTINNFRNLLNFSVFVKF